MKVGIAGYGDTGKKRARAIDAHPQTELVAVADKNEYADYKDFGKMISREKLDALFVCLPNYLADEATIHGLRNGLHVFCEKPPAHKLEALSQIESVSRKRPNQILMYGFNHRLHDSVIDTQEMIDSFSDGRKPFWMRGVYGKSRLNPFEGNWRSSKDLAGGGILLDQGIHMLDLFRVFGGEFEVVGSIVSNKYYAADVEDNVMALLRNDRCFASIHSSATLWSHQFTFDIGLADQVISLEGILSGTKSYGEETMTVIHRTGERVGAMEKIQKKYLEDKSWLREVDEFWRAISTGNRGSHGLISDARATMELVFNIYEKDASWNQS